MSLLYRNYQTCSPSVHWFHWVKDDERLVSSMISGKKIMSEKPQDE